MKKALSDTPRTKRMNKFYCAATHISVQFGKGKNDPWTRPTLDAAVRHAEDILDSDRDLDCVAIVKIVAVVRRQKQPVKVEAV